MPGVRMSCPSTIWTSPTGRSASPTWLPLSCRLLIRGAVGEGGPSQLSISTLHRLSPALRPSRQAQQLLDDLESHREALTRLGFEYGYSRLAVRSFPKNGDAGCVYCGLCLYGCPYSLIYSSAHSLPELESFPGFGTFQATMSSEWKRSIGVSPLMRGALTPVAGSR